MIRRAGELEPASWNEALAWVAGALDDSSGIALVSAGVSNEALFYTRRLLDRIGIEGGTFQVDQGDEVTLSGFPKLKLRADRAPNAAGAELQGFRRSDGLPDVSDGATLVVLGDALAGAPTDYGANAGFFLYIGSHLVPAAGNATAILPAATVPEADGTFVNYEGRVQRFHRALRSPGVARPGWMFLSRLLEKLGGEPGVREIDDAFAVMAMGTAGMEAMSWAGLGLRGELLSEAGQPAVAVE
jgi:predicted molibdopterin-dependent oxidoreductase YjgC